MNALPPIVANTEPDSNITVFKFVAPWNARSPILLTEAGIVMEVNSVDEQLVNASEPILVHTEPASNITSANVLIMPNVCCLIDPTPAGIVTEVSFVDLNAYFPMLVTLLGIGKVCNFVAPMNANSPID